MKRDIETTLLSWKNQPEHLPLLLRGARQVGKSYVVEQFGQKYFENLVTVNFELNPELKICFSSLDPLEIIKQLSLLTNQKIQPEKTLLFLDEIQDCPAAISALRYFKEKMPALHVIGAGSLLEFTLNDANFRMPVGRIQSLYLKPLSFKEYLSAFGYEDLRKEIETVSLQFPPAPAIHTLLIKLTREYAVLGGMPGVLKNYLHQKDFGTCLNLQTALLSTYRQDFGKYAKQTDHKYLQRLFEKAPGLIAKNFKYSSVDPDMRSRDLKNALMMLNYAGLIYSVYATNASGLPLISLINEKKFKILFLDIGLASRASGLEASVLLNEDILLVDRGSMAEQFVGQELLACASPFEESRLFFWERDKKSSLAEVDFVTHYESQIIPIEVKAGSTGGLKSLKVFMDEKNTQVGIRISQQPLSFEKNILSIPTYMVGEIGRLIKQI